MANSTSHSAITIDREERMKLKNFISDMKSQGFTETEIKHFLEDGEALKNAGFIEKNEVDTEHEKALLRSLIESLSDDKLYLTWELKDNPRLKPYLDLVEDSHDLQGDQISRGEPLYQNISFGSAEYWIFINDDWHGFQELREAIEFVIDFKDYNLEGRA